MYAACASTRAAKSYNNKQAETRSIVLPRRDERKRIKSLPLSSQMEEAWFSPPNNNILLREYSSSTTTTIILLWSRFVFFCTRFTAVRSSTPSGGRFLQLSKAHGLTHTRNPALCRAGHFTFVECRRRCIMVCATIEDTNQMATFINHNQSMTTLTMEESIRAQ